MELSLNEADRLATLYLYGVLDTDFEERFDRLTRVAAAVFGTPISLISLVDADRQWFKSSLGMQARETPRDISFCTHAIGGNGVYVVPDAANNPQFARNPLVTGDPHIRFYAGAPIVTRTGHALGTFCVIDRQPRVFDAMQRQLLQDFANTVMEFFEMQRLIRDARANRVRMRECIDEAERALRGPIGSQITPFMERLKSLVS